MARPELGPIAVGDEVFVKEIDRRNVRIHPATVAKLGRVWITLRAAGSGREWRMLIDGQRTNRGFGHEDIFVTPAQLAYDQELAAARDVLIDHGIMGLRSGSVLATPEGTLMLAKLLREHAQSSLSPS